MSIRLNTAVFRRLTNWNAERVRDTGGITIPTLLMLRDYARHLAGMAQGASVQIYVKSSATHYLWFGVTQGISCTEETVTEVRMHNMDPFFIHHDPEGEVKWYLEPADSGGPSPTVEEKIRRGHAIEQEVGILLYDRDLIFLKRGGEDS